MSTLLIDNYDSFTYNLYQYLGELGADPVVYRNDKITLSQAREMNPAHIVISPGPGDPRDRGYFGVCQEIIEKLGSTIPLLGVCLGHQGIGHVFGGKVIQAPTIMHGKTSVITHDGKGLFQDIPSPLSGMRYHSLIIEQASFPDVLEISAQTEDGIIMGLRHRTLPIHGIQFHPESVGTETGQQLLANFLKITA